MKNKRGITLIALIITIVVLLILAGVSISIIIGDNGVVKQAQEAKIKTDLAMAQEALEMTISSLESEYMSLLNENVNADIAEIFRLGKINSELEKLGYKFVDYDDSKSNDCIFGQNSINGAMYVTQIKLKKGSNQSLYDVVITKNNKREVSINNLLLANEEKESKSFCRPIISDDNIGDDYDYTVTIGNQVIDDWNVFLIDKDKITNNTKGFYIITKDYLPVNVLLQKDIDNKTIIEKTGMSIKGKYRICWDSVKDQIDFIDDEIISNYHNKYILTNSYDNSKCVSTLLNSNNWKDFVVEDSGAIFSIGAPTLEMWIESWNKENKKYKNNNVISCEGKDNVYGYKMKVASINGVDTGDEYDNYLSSSKMFNTDIYKINEKNNLYYPNKNEIEDNNGFCKGYWLASPSAGDDKSLCRVQCVGGISYNGFATTVYGLRPLVYISQIDLDE